MTNQPLKVSAARIFRLVSVMMSHRLACFLFLILFGSLSLAHRAGAQTDPPVKALPLWPAFPRPSEVIILRPSGDPKERVVAEMVAGLAARHARLASSPEPYVWLRGMHGRDAEAAFTLWQQRSEVPTSQFKGAVWDLVRQMKDQGVVKGYVLYRADFSDGEAYGKDKPSDLSLNLASSICGVTNAIAVDESQESLARAAGLTMLADARGKNYEWVLQQVGNQASTQLLALLDPRTPEARDLAVATDALVVLNCPGGGFEEALHRMQSGATVYGWGMTPEDAFVKVISAAGLKMVAANWSSNLPVLMSGSKPFAPSPGQPVSASVIQPGLHYVAFLMSDGDNLTWFTGDFDGKMFYGNPARGSIPFGWSVPFSTLEETSCDLWQNLAAQATPNDDYIQFGVRGYTFIDLMPPAALATDTQQLSATVPAPWLRSLGAFTHGQWDSPASRSAYTVVAQNCPSLQGVFAVQYYPYAAGHGAIYTVSRGDDKVAVCSALYSIWNYPKPHKDGGSPESAAEVVNTWARQPVHAPQDQFTWIIVHAWSNFGGEVEGVSAAQAAAKLFDPSVQVVKPSQLMEMIHTAVNQPAP